MKTIKTFIYWILFLISLALIYLYASLTKPTWGLPLPSCASADALAKLLALISGLLTTLAAWLNSRVTIELFSAPEVTAIGYYNNFLNSVVPKHGLIPCYIFLPSQLSELDPGLASSPIDIIKKKGLNCEQNEQRVYVITNPSNGKKVFLDLPSTLKTLKDVIVAKRQSNGSKFQIKLQKKFVGSFKKHLAVKLGVDNGFDFTDKKRLSEPLAGFKELA